MYLATQSRGCSTIYEIVNEEKKMKSIRFKKIQFTFTNKMQILYTTIQYQHLKFLFFVCQISIMNRDGIVLTSHECLISLSICHVLR